MNTFIIIIITLLNAFQPIFQGSLQLNLDYLLYLDTANKYRLELFYEIPYSSLSFVKDTAGFSAEYRFTIELLDQHKNIIGAQFFEQRVRVSDYSLTINRNLSKNDAIRIEIPNSAVFARVTCSDLKSERRSSAYFTLTKQSGTIILRLLKSGQPNANRTYGLNDTIEILSEINIDYPGDSLQITIEKGQRNVIRKKIELSWENGIKKAHFLLPVIDSFGRPRLGSGIYVAEASLPSRESPKGTIDFKIDLPFYFDDSLWVAKVNQLLYIATYGGMKKLKKTPKELRKQAWDEFWQDKDPNPSTEINEREEEYFQRISYCEEHYAQGDRGYKSDRAKIYITYGPPDQIEYRPFEIDHPAEEIWYYYQSNLTFVFIDRFGSGQFILWTGGR